MLPGVAHTPGVANENNSNKGSNKMNNTNTLAIGRREILGDMLDLLEAEVQSGSPFSLEFCAALKARDAEKVQALTMDFADEVMHQYHEKKKA